MKLILKKSFLSGFVHNLLTRSKTVPVGLLVFTAVCILLTVFVIIGSYGNIANMGQALLVMLSLDAVGLQLLSISLGRVKGNLVNRKTMRENGEKYSGKIAEFRKNAGESHGSDNKTKYHVEYYAVIKGAQNGEAFSFTTPDIAFDPNKLKSKNVTVYSYDGKYYADDFDL